MTQTGQFPQSPASSKTSFQRRCVKWIAACVGLTLCGVIFYALLMSVTTPREVHRRSQCRNNLRDIGLALHNYHDTYGTFPPAYVADSQGRPIHSWRVLLLPYLDQGALYKEYRFDEPWDGPNNQKLAKRLVPVYRCPSDVVEPGSAESFATSYVAVVGPETLWRGDRGVCPCDVYDAMETTLSLVEVVNSGIHWMEPRDLHVGQMAPTINPSAGQGISSRHTVGAHVLRADGSVRWLSEKLSAETIHNMLTIQGGETIPDDF